MPRLRIPRIKVEESDGFSYTIRKHSCWGALVFGVVLTAIGIILRSALIDESSTTAKSSGLLFIVIGVFIGCLTPFAALYKIVSNRKSNRTSSQLGLVEAGDSPRPSLTTCPPTYNQAIIDCKSVDNSDKNGSPTNDPYLYPQVLSPMNLSEMKRSSLPPCYVIQEEEEYENTIEKVDDNRRVSII